MATKKDRTHADWIPILHLTTMSSVLMTNFDILWSTEQHLYKKILKTDKNRNFPQIVWVSTLFSISDQVFSYFEKITTSSISHKSIIIIIYDNKLVLNKKRSGQKA